MDVAAVADVDAATRDPSLLGEDDTSDEGIAQAGYDDAFTTGTKVSWLVVWLFHKVNEAASWFTIKYAAERKGCPRMGMSLALMSCRLLSRTTRVWWFKRVAPAASSV